MVELDVTIGSKELYDYNLRHSYNSPAGLVGSCAGALFVVMAVLSQRRVFIAFGLIILLYLPVTLFLKSKQQVMMNPSFKSPLHYLLNEEGLTISQGEASIQYQWDQMYKAVSTTESIILYTSPINATIFPREQAGDKLSSVIEMICTHMAPGKVRIRY